MAESDAGTHRGEAAYEQLRADIISCQVQPGQRLTERSLSEALGLGLSPVRYALTKLDHDGLVRRLPRKGYQVAGLSLRSVDALFEAWRIIGPEIARAGVAGADEATRERLAHLLEALGPAPLSPADPRESLRRAEVADQLFGLLAEASGNTYLIDGYRRLGGEVARVWAFVFGSEVADPAPYDVSAEVAGLLGRGDSDAAALIAVDYIDHAYRRARQVLERWPSVMDTEVEFR